MAGQALGLFAAQAAMAIANARRHREELRARANLETLIDTSPVGVVVFDARTGMPMSFNREARRIVNILRNPDQAPEDLLDVINFRRSDGREISLREFPIAELLSTGETVRAEEIVLLAPDGRNVTALINATPIFSNGGEVESMVVTLQDMADVQELERLRAEFLAMVSHELRTPLTSIKGSASTIMDAGMDLDPAVVRQFIRIIGDQADHMNALVGDLLDVARIETGTLPVSPEPAEVAVLVDRARSGFTNAGGKNKLAIDVEPGLPLVMADRRRIVQALGNLLSSAARHSSESSAIRVSAVRRGIHVAVSVADEGRGIPAESDGLGMGACFTFTLPSVEDFVDGAAGRIPSFSTREPAAEEERPRILAVDDDPQYLRYVRDTLARSGYDPVVTGEPEEALRLVADERPELVLLDLMIPDADGIELMKDILDVADVPVIFLSAYGREEFVARAFEMGPADYVVKPFSPTELAARIRAALRRRAVADPSEPYVLGDLTIDYALRRVTLAGQWVSLTPKEYGVLAELSSHAGRALDHEHLLERVWNETGDDKRNLRPMRTIVSKLRRKLGDDVRKPTYIFTAPRVGFRMPSGTRPGGDPPATH